RLERLILSRHGAPSLSAVCPVGLESIIAKLLAPNAAERYSSAHAIREDLERFKSGEPTQAEQEGWPRTADEPETRRTQARIDTKDEKTRRTPKSENVSQESKTAHRDTERTGTENKNPTPERPRIAAKKIRRFVAAAVLVLALGIGGNEIWVGVNAAEI